MSAILGIVGLGAIGGSIGLRARALGWPTLGYDASPEAAALAERVGVVNALGTRADLYARATTVVIAAHLDGTLDELARLRREPAAASLILDVASVKRPVVAAGRAVPGFVATHPMSGTAASGAAAAGADRFEGRPWLYVPSTDRALDRRVEAFVAAMGARPVAVDAAAHDAAVALTSHLPQVLAWEFARMVAERGIPEYYFGPVARELLRIAPMATALWEPVLRANADAIDPLREELAQRLGRVQGV